VEGARHRKPLGAHAVIAQSLLGAGQAALGSGQHKLVGGVVVRHRQAALLCNLLHGRALARAYGDHAAGVAGLRGVLHEATAGGHQP
jgi:hypothetical protein